MRRFLAILFLLTVMSFFTALIHLFFFKTIGSRQFHILDEPAMTYLTLFTTIKETGVIPHHQAAFNIVMTNWPSFTPYVRPVLFLNLTNSSLANEARLAGWDVLPLEGANPAGTPFLKNMYRTVFNRYESVFYGFANADILYDDSLVKTLLAIQSQMEELNNNVLVIGRRTNVDVNLSLPINPEEFSKSRLQDTADAQGKLFMESAIDYFLFTKEDCSFNWSKISNVVIGRPAYDNYLVAMAISYGVNVIDATETILAVHMSEAGVISHGKLNEDASYNNKLIGTFSYDRGFTSRAQLATAYGEMNKVVLGRRKEDPWKTRPIGRPFKATNF